MIVRLLPLAILLAASSANAASPDMPKRKPGLWETKISQAGSKQGHTMQQCIDEKTDDLIKSSMGGPMKPDCSKIEFRREGDKLVTEAVCKMSGSTMTTKGVFTGNYDSTYRGDLKTTYDPPMHGMRESSTTIDAKWLGGCKPGQKPGDISMPGMPNININEMMKQMPKGR